MDPVAHPHAEATAEKYDFHDSLPSSDDFEFGDREDEPSPPRPDVAELATYLLPQVPGQDEDVVGPGLGETLRRVDRYMGTGEVPALLHRRAVHRVGEKIRPDAAVVEQRVALARSAVAGHGPALTRRGEQEVEQVALDLQDRGRELLVTGDGMQSRGLLRGQYRLDPL